MDGAITAVILGLAAQQTIGNQIAGTVLLSARPFRVGDRVRMHAGGVGGQVEGMVTSLGLLYTTLANGEDRILVPNNVVLSGAVVPLRELAAWTARPPRRAGEAERGSRSASSTACRCAREPTPGSTSRSSWTEKSSCGCAPRPSRAEDGAALADEVLAALDAVHTAQQDG